MATGDRSDVLVKRLHISGLTPHFSREALRERLESYGRVLDLVGCEDSFTNGVGQRRPYAFATMETTPSQLAKCLNTLSGAIWKGAKLRIGEARPLWHERLAKERTKAHADALHAKDVDRRQRWLRKRPWIGREANNMEPITLERVKEGEWGWKVTPAGHLVRPMHMRWTRPLPRPSDADLPRRPPHTPRRAPCTTIDPTRYRREHLSGPMFDAMSTDMASWHWTWDEEARVWRAYEHGTCVSTDTAPPPRALPMPSTEWPLLSEEAPGSVGSEAAEEEALSDTLFDVEAPPEDLFDAPPTSGAWWADDEAHAEPPQAPTAEPEPEPRLPSTSAAPRPSREDPGLFDLSDFSDGYEEMEHAEPVATTDEHARALHVLDHLFGPALSAPSPPPASAPMDVFEDEEDAEPEAVSAPTEQVEEAAPVSAHEPDVHMDSLKTMFQPAEETEGFTLFGDLGADEELDPEMDEVVTGSAATDAVPATTPVMRAPAPRTLSRLPPLTTPHTLATGAHSMIPALLQLGSSPFWKGSTDEEIESAWISKRAELTQTYRRLHREGVKKRRRRVVGARAATATGGLAPARGARPQA